MAYLPNTESGKAFKALFAELPDHAALAFKVARGEKWRRETWDALLAGWLEKNQGAGTKREKCAYCCCRRPCCCHRCCATEHRCITLSTAAADPRAYHQVQAAVLHADQGRRGRGHAAIL